MKNVVILLEFRAWLFVSFPLLLLLFFTTIIIGTIFLIHEHYFIDQQCDNRSGTTPMMVSNESIVMNRETILTGKCHLLKMPEMPEPK